MTDPTFIGRVTNDAGLALDASPGYQATPKWTPVDLNNKYQVWAWYPDPGYLSCAGGEFTENNGWVGLYNSTPLKVDGLWQNSECYWAMTTNPDGSFQLSASGGTLGAASDGTATIIRPTNLKWNTQQPAPPSTGLTPMLGLFGDDPTQFAANYLGGKRPVDYEVIFADSDTLGVSWQISQISPPSLPVMYSLTMVPNGGTLADAVAGAYNGNFVAGNPNSGYAGVVASLAQYGTGAMRGDTGPYKDLLMLRIAWEMNTVGEGSYPWSAAGGQAANYIAAFRNYVRVLRAGLPGVDVKIIWCPNRGMQAVDPETCYPGDDVVDWVAIDCYENSTWDTETDGNARFQAIAADTGRSLTWIAGFSVAHGKPLCFPEWGSNINGTPFYQLMHDYMVQNSTISQAVWVGNPFDFNSSPLNGPAYQTAFENWPS